VAPGEVKSLLGRGGRDVRDVVEIEENFESSNYRDFVVDEQDRELF
jgi:hypothetical protein